MKNWWKSHLRTFDSLAEMKEFSIEISVPHMWTRLFWFCWQKKLATASPEWVNLNGKSIQFPISFYAMLFCVCGAHHFSDICISVCMFAHFSLSFILRKLNKTREINNMHQLSKKCKFSWILTRACAYVVVVP